MLASRPIKDSLQGLQKDKEGMSNERVKISSKNKSNPWTVEELEEVLKYLKKGKARDPNDHANEIYKMEIAGDDVKNAILVLMNKIKEQIVYPYALEACNLTSIYKKGKRNIFDNYRGVFRLTILRSILDRLIYNDVYPIIDSNLTDANVGARKGRNIRDNLFVLNAITNSIKRGHEEACEVVVYDAEKCFDSLWSEDCTNELYNAGCDNVKLALLHCGTRNANVAIKTSQGITKRINITNIIMQGGVFGSLQCTASIDSLAKEVYSRKELIYIYKGVAAIPPLLMVDDILTVSKCSPIANAMNTTVNAFVETKN